MTPSPQGNVIPLHRGIRQMQTTIERKYREHGRKFIDELYDTPAERARIAAVVAGARRFRLQALIQWGAIGLAVVTVGYFALEFLR